MVVTKKVADAVSAYSTLKAEIARLTEQSEAHRALIIESVNGEGAVEYKGQTIARVTVTERKTTDTKSILSAYPAIAEAVSKGEFTNVASVTSVRLP